jgi:predicted amidohydrolase
LSSLRIASAQYPIGRFDSFAAWHAHVADWVAGAAGQGAELLLFPEYGAMELASMLPEALQRDLTAQISALQDYHQDFVATFAELAKRHDVHIVAPSLPVAVGNQVRNRAYLLSPNGAIGFQEKRQMTRFEREVWGIYGGDELKVFDIAGKTGNVRIGIAILAPSCTDTMAGANRVQVGARARALENQVYVAVSPTVGLAEWSLAVDVNVGWASILATPDRGFPDDGVIARGELSQPGWIHAELDFAALKAAREETEVFTRKDWDGQDKPSLEVTAIKL